MTIKDEDIEEIINFFVIIANKEGALKKIFDQYNESKSLVVKITGSQFNTGFVVKDNTVCAFNQVHNPTVTITLDKATFWDVLNSDTSGIARAKLMVGLFTDEKIKSDPPPGIGGGMIHLENILSIFTYISRIAIGE